MGASFGAVASLAAAWRHQGFFGRLLLQSGSFVFTLAATFLLEVYQLLALFLIGWVIDTIRKWSDGAKDKPGVLGNIAAAVHDMTWWIGGGGDRVRLVGSENGYKLRGSTE